MDFILNKRLDYLDAAKGIGILLIVLGHVSYQYGCISNLASYFKISIFYVISGYLQSLSTKELSIKNKAKALLIPYAFFSAIYMIILISMSFIKGLNFLEIGVTLIDIISLRGISTLWFLPSLLLAIIIHKIVSNRVVRISMFVIIPLVLIFYSKLSPVKSEPQLSLTYFLYCIIITLGKGIAAYWFYEISYLWLNRIISCSKFIMIRKVLSIASFMIMCVVALLLGNSQIDFNRMQLGVCPAMFFVFGILFSFDIIICLEMVNFKSKILQFFGINSLFIMCTHLPLFIVTISNKIIRMLIIRSSEPQGIEYLMFVLFVFIAVCLIETILILIWKKIKPAFVKRKMCAFFKYVT